MRQMVHFGFGIEFTFFFIFFFLPSTEKWVDGTVFSEVFTVSDNLNSGVRCLTTNDNNEWFALKCGSRARPYVCERPKFARP
eukprot:m.133453 g.133453  ORF g.133453 m.133453 type:complete len:82 (-) comp23816_c0_seq3:105-350(-)